MADDKVPTFARIIAAMQMLGATAAAVMMAVLIVQAPLHLLSLLIVAVMYAVFWFAFVSGMRLWRGERRGYRASMLVQALQIPVIHTNVLTYKFIFGFGATVFFSGGTGTVNFEFGGLTNLIFMGDEPDPRFGINVWAPILLAYLYQKQPRPEINESD